MSENISNIIYTAGYQAIKSPELLSRFAIATNAIVVDTRLTPYSQLPGWRRSELERQYQKGQYRYLGQWLGNLNYKNGGPIRIADPERGFVALAELLSQQSVILLCACGNVQTCHRSVIAEMLADATGATVQHLDSYTIRQAIGDNYSEVTFSSGKFANIPALSLWGPWDWLMVSQEEGAKRIENRVWPTAYCGPVLLHASKTFDPDWKQPRSNKVIIPPDIQKRIDAGKLPASIFEKMPKSIEEYPCGGIVGITTIVDCVTYSNDGWFFGPYGFVLRDSHPLTFVPCLGNRKFFQVGSDVIEKLNLAEVGY